MRFIPVLVTLLALSACLPFQKDTAAPIVEIGTVVEAKVGNGAETGTSHIDDSLLPVSDSHVVEASDVEVSGVKVSGSAEAINAEDPVIVPYFQVVFFTNVSPPELNDDSEENVAVDARLIGIADESLQVITDQVYGRFIEKLKQHGMNVLPMSSLEISPTYQKFVEATIQSKETPPSGLKAAHVVPTGLKVSDPTRSLDESYLDSYFDGSYDSWEYGGFDNKVKKNKGKEISKILTEMNASIMDVTLYVTHTKQEIKSTLKVVKNIEIESLIRVRSGSRIQFYGFKASMCEGYCPNPVVNITLEPSLESSKKVGDMMVILKPSDKSEGFVAKTLSWLTLGSSESKADVSHYELRADKQKYQEVVTEILNEATDKLVAGLASVR